MEPFGAQLDFRDGTLEPVGQVIQRRLSDTSGMYADAEAERRILEEEGDRLIYGDEPFIFFAAWPGDAGHDYSSIEQAGFAKLLVARDGRPTLVDNPKYR